LIGGGAALLTAGAGIGAWEFFSHNRPQQQQNRVPTSTPVTRSSPAPDPTAPAYILRGHTSDITGLAWSPAPTAQSTLASIGNDGQVLLWNVTGQQQLLSHSWSQSPGVAGNEMELAWSPDGRYIAAGYGDSTVIIWKVDSV